MTTEQDERTRQLCEQHDLERVVSHRIHEQGARFNKGKGLNDGLAALEHPDWVICIDADILLPRNFRQVFERSELLPHRIYTCKYRANCPDRAALDALQYELYERKGPPRLGVARTVSRKLFGKSRTRRWFGPLADQIIANYPVLTDAVVMQEIDRRKNYCLRMGIEDGEWREASLEPDEVSRIKQEWLVRHRDRVSFERNDFKAGFVQLFHADCGRRFSEEFDTAGMVDTEFFEQFYEIRDESDRYSGRFGRFKVRNWSYLTVPKKLAGRRLHYLLCFHVGRAYEDWEGRG